jgi:uncharacterized protein (TIGR02266 family)
MTTAKVLLVDDVRVFLEFERPFFERSGCEILTATSGTEALRLVKEQKPHIVLLDYEMPGMNGDEVCRRIKEDESTRHIPVLIVTSHKEPSVLERCRQAGCTDLVLKPVTGRDLLEKVIKILQIPYRVHMRTRVNLEVAMGLSGEAVSVLGYSSDLSEGGMLVETVEPIEAGTKVGISFKLQGRQVELRTVGEVLRVTVLRSQGMFGVAVKFGENDPAFCTAVREFVEQEVAR